MARRDTKLESEGAEFLVLGNRLIHKIATYKTYTNMPGYDLVATEPNGGKSARIQVRCRWANRAPGFLIKNLSCDFVVFVRLNRGSKKKIADPTDPEYFVFPIDLIRSVQRTATWHKVLLNDIEDLDQFRDSWILIADYLGNGLE